MTKPGVIQKGRGPGRGIQWMRGIQRMEGCQGLGYKRKAVWGLQASPTSFTRGTVNKPHDSKCNVVVRVSGGQPLVDLDSYLRFGFVNPVARFR